MDNQNDGEKVAVEILKNELKPMCDEALAQFKEKKGIPNAIEYDNPRDLSDSVATETAKQELDAFFEELPESVSSFVSEKNSIDTLSNRISHKYDYGRSYAIATSKILRKLKSNAKTNSISSTYWLSIIKRINPLAERIKASRNINYFLQRYAPGWQTVCF